MSKLEEWRAAGFSEEEITQHATQKRQEWTAAGFAENEIDAYFAGGVVVPDAMPAAMQQRLAAGTEARHREGGLMQTIPQFAHLVGTPDGRSQLWEAVKKYPGVFVDGMKEMLTLPGDAAAGAVDLTTDEGRDKAVGLGMLIGGARLSKLPLNAKTSGIGPAMGEPVSRISRTPDGQIVDIPVGTLPRADDFVNAARAIGEDAPLARQEKLLELYEQKGIHPAEVAHDAAQNPVVKQSILSSEKADVPQYPKPPAPPEPPPPPPKAPKPPDPPEPGSLAEAQAKVLEKISVGDRDGKSLTWRQVYTDFIDGLHPIKAAGDDAYVAARLTRGTMGRVEHFLEHGTFDFNTLKTTGKPFREILAPVRDDLQGFRAYLASRRAKEIEATGRASGIDMPAAETVVKGSAAKFEAAANELVAYQNSLIAYLRDSGVLSAKAFDAMVEAGKSYVPFYRVFLPEEAGGAGKGLGPGNPVKALKGSERGIVDPIESIIKNTFAYISIAERNAAGIKIVDALSADGAKVTASRPKPDAGLVEHLRELGVKAPEDLAAFITETAKPDGTTISAWRDGKRVSVETGDQLLVDAFRGLDSESANMVIRVLALPSKTLRAGATLSPDFMARNVVRDFLTAFVNSKGVFSPIDTFKGAVGAIRKDADFQNWMKSGGANSTLVALDRRYLQENIASLTAETGLQRAWNVAKNPLVPLRMASELFEQATRLGEFKKIAGGGGTKAELQAAAFASREVTLDFARIGAKMRAWNMISAFANAHIQGMDRVTRAFIDRPLNTSAKIAAGVTLPSVLLWFANRDDERVKELPDWQKDLFWIVATDKWEPISAVDAANKPWHLVRQKGGQWEVNNGHIYRIPKPFEVGVIFGSGAERVLDATIGKDPEAFKGFSKSVVDMLLPNVLPTATQPMLEQFANRSTFTDRTLIPAPLEKQLPEYQYTPYTTELSKALGGIVAAFPGIRERSVEPGAPGGAIARAATSPILIENYVRSWTGGLGNYAMEATDYALRKAGVLPDPVKPTPTLADIPFVKAFAVRYPSATAESIQKFYDEHERDKRYFDTWVARAQEGDGDAMAKIQGAGGPQMFVRLDAIKSTLTDHGKLIRDIYKMPNMPPDEKRQLIDGLYFSMIEIAKSGREALKQAKVSAP